MFRFLLQGYEHNTSMCLPENWALGRLPCWLMWFSGYCFPKGNVAQQSSVPPANPFHFQPRPNQCICCGQPCVWRWWGFHLQIKQHLISLCSLHVAQVFPIHPLQLSLLKTLASCLRSWRGTRWSTWCLTGRAGQHLVLQWARRWGAPRCSPPRDRSSEDTLDLWSFSCRCIVVFVVLAICCRTVAASLVESRTQIPCVAPAPCLFTYTNKKAQTLFCLVLELGTSEEKNRPNMIRLRGFTTWSINTCFGIHHTLFVLSIVLLATSTLHCRSCSCSACLGTNWDGNLQASGTLEWCGPRWQNPCSAAEAVQDCLPTSKLTCLTKSATLQNLFLAAL